MSPGAKELLRYGSLALLALACFLPVLGYDFLVTSDDWDYVIANPAVRAGLTRDGLRWALGFHAANWHPLTWLSHMADVTLFGMKPAGHHLTSLLLHAANAALLGLGLARLTGQAGRSWLAAALFAVHPTRIESVAWVAERKDVLCALFSLLATAAYVRATRAAGRWRLAPALALFGLALAAKPMAVTLPVLLLALDRWPLGRLRDLRRDAPLLVLEKLPFLAMAAGAGALTVLAQHAGLAVKSLAAYPLAVRLANVPLAYAAYARAFVWPAELSAFYEHPGERLSWGASLATAAVLAVAGVLVARSRRPWLQAGGAWFLVSLLPVIGIVQVGEQARADRYSYLPYVGLCVALVWGGGELLDRLARPAPAQALLGALLVCALVVATRRELPHWRDALSLYGRAIELDPDNHFALQNRGVALLYAGDLAGARRDFDHVLRLRPDYHFALRAAAEAASRAGDVVAATGYQERLMRAQPGDAVAVARLGDMRLAGGDLQAALALYSKARAMAPGLTSAAYPHAVALIAAGQLEPGLRELQVAVAGSPERADWRRQLEGARQLAAGASGPERSELQRAIAACHAEVARGLRRRGLERLAAAHEQQAARLSR